MANPKIEVEIGAKVKDLNKGFDQVDQRLKGTQKEFGKLNDFAVGALQGIAAAFTVGAIVNFGKAVLDTTAKFQRFEAVLTNTLGSNSDAQIALIQIQDFASKTPFAVDELTSSFVKLANQGFKPTINELRSLGDLASSTGKGFDQLAEAIIDAQVGEFKRLKEFGVRAKKEGDNVTFTFKGVETQVKATDSAIRGYILSLGDAEGVSGKMAGISETLGGKISNLGDNLESLKLAIGNQTSGLYATSIDWLNEFVSLATAAAKGVAQIREEASLSKIGNIIAQNRTQVEGLAESYLKLDPNITKQAAFAKAIADVSRGYREAAEGGEAFQKQSLSFSELDQVIEGFNSLSIELLNVSVKTDKADESVKKLKRTLEDTSKISQSLTFASLDRAEFFANQFEAPISATSGKAETQGINAAPIVETADVLEEQSARITSINDILVQSFSGLGNQVANSFNISDDALKGFVGTLISNVPKIIQAIFQQAAARKAAAAIENQANLQVATGAAIATGAKAASGLGPVGLALLPVFVGGAVALISKAFGKSGGGSGGGSVGSSVSGQTFSGTGISDFNPNRELFGELVVRGNDLVYVLGETRTKIAKG